MTQTRITHLLPRHTAANIEICYDDHTVSLRQDGSIMNCLSDDRTTIIKAVWTGKVTLQELIDMADRCLYQSRNGGRPW